MTLNQQKPAVRVPWSACTTCDIITLTCMQNMFVIIMQLIKWEKVLESMPKCTWKDELGQLEIRTKSWPWNFSMQNQRKMWPSLPLTLLFTFLTFCLVETFPTQIKVTKRPTKPQKEVTETFDSVHMPQYKYYIHLMRHLVPQSAPSDYNRLWRQLLITSPWALNN